MSDLNHQPDDSRLAALLREARVAPALPPRFQQNVWCRIEDAEAPARSGSWLDALAGLVLRPRLAMAVAAILLVAGVAAGTVEGKHAARHEAQMNYLASVAPDTAR